MERSGVAIERFDGKSDEYVAAAFDTYCDAGPTGRFDGATALEILLGSTTAAPETDPRKDMIERQKRASQQPLTHHV
jgi:hypothetical protein